ncbi:MAG: preprotein translocase subunit SecE [Clostridium sp.]|nr:preprotein translocase subunit SecE [Clostridium sp.]
MKTEYKKIVFADRQTVTKQTVAVVISSIFLGIVIMLLDMAIKFGLGFIF